MALILSSEHYEILCQHCKQCWPEEACALLVGTEQKDGRFIVNSVAVSDNIAADRSHFFEIDPGVRIRLEKDLRGTQESIIGVFHSHPNGPAMPSKADENMIIERHLIWLIAAVENSILANLKAFKPKANSGFSSVTLEIKDR